MTGGNWIAWAVQVSTRDAWPRLCSFRSVMMQWADLSASLSPVTTLLTIRPKPPPARASRGVPCHDHRLRQARECSAPADGSEAETAPRPPLSADWLRGPRPGALHPSRRDRDAAGRIRPVGRQSDGVG